MRCATDERSGFLEMTRRDEFRFWLSTGIWCLTPLVVGLIMYWSEQTIESAVVSMLVMTGLVAFRLTLELPRTVVRIDFDETGVTLRLYLSGSVVRLPYHQIPAITTFDYARITRYSIVERGTGRQWILYAATAEENLALTRMLDLWTRVHTPEAIQFPTK